MSASPHLNDLWVALSWLSYNNSFHPTSVGIFVYTKVYGVIHMNHTCCTIVLRYSSVKRLHNNKNNDTSLCHGLVYIAISVPELNWKYSEAPLRERPDVQLSWSLWQTSECVVMDVQTKQGNNSSVRLMNGERAERKVTPSWDGL